MSEGADGETAAANISEESDEVVLKMFEELVNKYGKKQNLEMFEYFHSPGWNVKHPTEVTDNIEYVLDGSKVKVRCKCGASLDLTDYTKLDKA